MRRWLFCILGVLAIHSVFSQGNVVWPESNSELVTNSNATIAIQTSSFSNISLDGYESIPSGSYIGVFYSNGISSYNCGGFTQWPDLDENFVIAAHGDDPFTSAADGFDEPEAHAAPKEIAMPSISNCINNVWPSILGNVILINPFNLGFPFILKLISDFFNSLINKSSIF